MYCGVCVALTVGKLLFTWLIFIAIICGQSNASGNSASWCPGRFFSYVNGDNPDRWYGTVALDSAVRLSGIYVQLKFDRRLPLLTTKFGDVHTDDNVDFYVENDKKDLQAKVPQILEFIVYHPDEPAPQLLKVKLNGLLYCPRNNSAPENVTSKTGEPPTTHKTDETPCTTPNGERAKCVPVNSCQPIIDAIQSRHREAVDFARQSQCGFSASPKVCCGRTGYPLVDTADVFLVETEVFYNGSVCGRQQQPKRVKRIANGERTEPWEFPWLAGILFARRNLPEKATIRCTGSLITDRYVLTSAHCLTNHRDYTPEAVYLGEWQLSTDPDCTKRDCAERAVRVNVEKSVPHFAFSARSKKNDVALVKLERKVVFTDFVTPVCLPSSNTPVPLPGTSLTTTGWGTTETGKTPDFKLKASLDLLTQEKCRELLKEAQSVNIDDSYLCMWSRKHQGTCNGDSGGPLMRSYVEPSSRTMNWYLEGVTSFGWDCGSRMYPEIYTNVRKYTDWIVENIRKN